MNSLKRPNIDPLDILSECIEGISDQHSHDHYEANRSHLDQSIIDFENASTNRTWYKLTKAKHGHPDQIVVGTLTKGQLTALYSTHLVKTSGPARLRYDEILVAANGKCPLCGGIGHTKTLDHYLPKAVFPAYSVVPTNLVPSCRDCNSGKSSSFPALKGAQTIHPYLDDEHFFLEKWTAASVINTKPITVKFEAHPPAGWSATDKNRAISHFAEFGLAERYGIEAAGEIATLEHLRKTQKWDYENGGFKQYLTEQGNDPAKPINGWKRNLYSALANTAWYSEVDCG